MRETKDVWAGEGLGLLAETDGVRGTQLANTVRGERVGFEPSISDTITERPPIS